MRRRAGPSAQPQVAHISRHLDRDDLEFLAGEHGHVRAPARAQHDQRIGPELGTAGAAPAPGGRLGDLQSGAREPGALGGQVEAEPDRVRHHAGQRADFQVHAGDLGAGQPLGDGVHHAFGDRQFVHAASRRGQQMRGSGSPTSRSTIRVPPNVVLIVTSPAGSAVTLPMIAACAPSGWARRAAIASSAWPPSTTATSRPSHATYRGSMPSSSAAPRTWARTGMASSATSTPTSAALAISFKMVATPPLVASRSARTPGTARSSPATSPARDAVSDSTSASMSSSPRASMIVTPWSPIGPETRIASPGLACATPRFTPAGTVPTPAVLM